MNYSPSERFDLCLKMAREIVRAYRAKVPDGIDPKNTYVAIAGTVISVGVGAYQAHQQGQAAKKAAGSVPKPAPYEPVDFTEEQLAAIVGNLSNLNAAKDLSGKTNAFITQDALTRAKKLIPGYKANMRQMGTNTGDLLAGRLPFEDVQGILEQQAGSTGSLGIPGTSGPATLKDLGISRLDAMKTGSGMLQDMVRTAETISPRAGYSKPQDSFVNPIDRIRLAIEQHALEQKSAQSANNLAATGSPGALAAAQGVGQVDYASIAQQLLAAYGKTGGLSTSSSSAIPTAPAGYQPNYSSPGPQPGTYYV